MPKVSVIIPAYNMAAYTVETIESILAQTYKDFEIIVVDDGSTDGTGDILKRFGNKIKYYYKENGGACSARNFGIKISSGKYIAFLDCDDLWMPEKLEKCIEIFEEDKKIGLVYTNLLVIDKKGLVLRKYTRSRPSGFVAHKLVCSNFIVNPSVMVRRKCLDSVGVFDEDIFYPADWDLWLRISERFAIKHLSQPLVKYRVHSNYLIKDPTMLLREGRVVIEKAFQRNPDWSLRLKLISLSNLYLLTSGVFLAAKQYVKFCRHYLRALIFYPFSIRHLIFWFKIIEKKLKGSFN